jgi:Mce-associated membrane protein
MERTSPVSSEDQPAGAVATSDPDTVGDPSGELPGDRSGELPDDPTDESPGKSPGDRAAEAGTADDRSERTTAKRPRWAWARRIRGPLALPLALTLVLALVGGVLTVRTAQLRDDPVSGNRALVDTAANTRAIGDVSNALTKIFSYSYTDTAATEQAARDVLAGTAHSQYEALFSQVMREAPAQGLTVTTRVARAGVVRLSGDTAQLLVFLDQMVTRRGDRSGTAAAAQLSVTAQLRDGHWRITDIQSR